MVQKTKKLLFIILIMLFLVISIYQASAPSAFNQEDFFVIEKTGEGLSKMDKLCMGKPLPNNFLIGMERNKRYCSTKIIIKNPRPISINFSKFSTVKIYNTRNVSGKIINNALPESYTLLTSNGTHWIKTDNVLNGFETKELLLFVTPKSEGNFGIIEWGFKYDDGINIFEVDPFLVGFEVTSSKPKIISGEINRTGSTGNDAYSGLNVFIDPLNYAIGNQPYGNFDWRCTNQGCSGNYSRISDTDRFGNAGVNMLNVTDTDRLMFMSKNSSWNNYKDFIISLWFNVTNDTSTVNSVGIGMGDNETNGILGRLNFNVDDLNLTLFDWGANKVTEFRIGNPRNYWGLWNNIRLIVTNKTSVIFGFSQFSTTGQGYTSYRINISDSSILSTYTPGFQTSKGTTGNGRIFLSEFTAQEMIPNSSTIDMEKKKPVIRISGEITLNGSGGINEVTGGQIVITNYSTGSSTDHTPYINTGINNFRGYNRTNGTSTFAGIRINEDSLIDMNATNQLTVGFWMRIPNGELPGGNDNDDYVFMKRWSAQGFFPAIILKNISSSSTNWTFRYTNLSNGVHNDIELTESTSSLSTGVWNHFVFVFNSTNLSIYRNGVSTGSAVWRGFYQNLTYVNESNTQTCFGACNDITTSANVSFDEMIVYDYALSPNEISVLYNRSSVAEPINLTMINQSNHKNLSVSYIYFDQNANSRSNTRVEWFKNGTIMNMFDQGTTNSEFASIVLSNFTNFTKGDVWFARLSVRDTTGEEDVVFTQPIYIEDFGVAVVGNQPYIVNLTFNHSTTDRYFNTTIFAGNDSISIWYKDNNTGITGNVSATWYNSTTQVFQQNISATNNTYLRFNLSPTNFSFSAGDNITIKVNATIGTAVSGLLQASIFVNNTRPEVLNLAFNQSTYTNSSNFIYVNWTGLDFELKSWNASAFWYANGTISIFNETKNLNKTNGTALNFTLANGNFSGLGINGGNISVYVNITDGYNFSLTHNVNATISSAFSITNNQCLPININASRITAQTTQCNISVSAGTSNIDRVTANVTLSNGSIVSQTVSNQSTTFNFTFSNTNIILGNYTITWSANLTTGTSTTSTNIIAVIDNTPPNITVLINTSRQYNTNRNASNFLNISPLDDYAYNHTSWFVNGTKNIANSTNFSFINDTPGIYNITAQSYDNSSNVNITQWNITVLTSQPRFGSAIQNPQSPVCFNETVSFRVVNYSHDNTDQVRIIIDRYLDNNYVNGSFVPNASEMTVNTTYESIGIFKSRIFLQDNSTTNDYSVNMSIGISIEPFGKGNCFVYGQNTQPVVQIRSTISGSPAGVVQNFTDVEQQVKNIITTINPPNTRGYYSSFAIISLFFLFVVILNIFMISRTELRHPIVFLVIDTSLLIMGVYYNLFPTEWFLLYLLFIIVGFWVFGMKILTRNSGEI